MTQSDDPNRHRRTPAADASREHDACGTGFVARASGERSHDIVRKALTALGRVAHRGAASMDNSGDGAGLLTQIPGRLLHRESFRLGGGLTPGPPFAVGMLFLPTEPTALAAAVSLVEDALRHKTGPKGNLWRYDKRNGTVWQTI